MTKFERLMDELGEKYDNLEENDENYKQFLLDLKTILDECEDLDKDRTDKVKKILKIS
jgi:chaperonin cofactor prefoldin